jgi:hypothetical protein
MERSELEIDRIAMRRDRSEDTWGPVAQRRLTRLRDGVDDNDGCPFMIVTASLTTGIARVAHGITASADLVNEIIRSDHIEWETTMYVGDVEFHCTKDGPFPNHQLRLSVRPSVGYAALNYMDHDDAQMPIANSFNPNRPPPTTRSAPDLQWLHGIGVSSYGSHTHS